MSDPALLADHIGQRVDEILTVWRMTVAREGDVPEAFRLSDAEFIDHVPELIQRLGERLRGHPADATPEGKKHGRLRWTQGYDIAEVVLEFGHLRTALLRSTARYANDRQWDLAQHEEVAEVINDIIDEMTAESVRQFQEDSRRETQAALAEARQRQEAIEEAWISAKTEQTKLRTILRNLPAAVWVVDAEGVIVGVNYEAERLQSAFVDAGRDRVDIRDFASSWPSFRPDGTACAFDELPLVRALAGETVSQEEYVWLAGEEPKSVLINASPLTDATGARIGAVGVAQDITSRKQAEAQLRRQRDLSRTITETLAEAICTVDAEGRLTFMNPAASTLLGWTEPELLGRNFHEAIHNRRPDGSPYPRAECPIDQVLHTGHTVRGDEVLFRRDGTPVQVTFTASPIMAEGRVVGVAQAFRDIGERKRLEADLAASEARFRSIAEKSPVMIWRTDASGRCDYVNQTWREFLGAGAHEPAAELLLRGVHPEDLGRCGSQIGEAIGRREPFELAYRLLRRDGQYRWISNRGTPYHDARGAYLGFLGSCLDITARIELEAVLDQQRIVAEEASRHKTQLVSALSHDARTPLNAVVLAAQLLEVHVGESEDAEVQECLRTIRHSVKNVLDLLNDLLDLSKIDAGGSPTEVSQFPIESAMAECLAAVENQARGKGLEIRLEPGPLAGLVLETDRSKLKQVLGNLLSNALRYTDRGHIRLYGERSEDQVRIAVEDTGIGIAAEDQGRIFEEFATLHNPRRPSGEGTGLGLAICRRLASLLKGEITLRSSAGVGSTFTLVLPATVVAGVETPREGPVAVEAPATGAILVAEDHVDSRQTLAKVLRRMGYRVLEAGNGHDALKLARREEKLVAVLMDVNMPVMDGIEATLQFRSDPGLCEVPIFALTGDVTLVNRHRIGAAGVDGYLEKPVSLDVLKQALSSLRAVLEG